MKPNFMSTQPESDFKHNQPYAAVGVVQGLCMTLLMFVSLVSESPSLPGSWLRTAAFSRKSIDDQQPPPLVYGYIQQLVGQ